MLSSNIITKRLISKIMLMNSVFTTLNIFLCFRNKVPPRPSGQRTEPEPSTVRYQLIFQIFSGHLGPLSQPVCLFPVLPYSLFQVFSSP